MRELRGLAFLAWLTFVRQGRARKTIVAVLLVALAAGAAFVWSRNRERQVRTNADRIKKIPEWLVQTSPDRLALMAVFAGLGDFHPIGRIERDYRPDPLIRFTTRYIMPVYVGFLLPILAMLYSAAALGDEREERTLVYLLVRPLTLWKVYFAKALGVLPLTMAAGVGGFAAICAAGGSAGAEAWSLFAPAVSIASATYSCLFLFFGAAIPRPMVVGVGYAFFAEFLVGNLPGTLKRLSIAYYCKCMMYDAGSPLGFQPDSRAQFLPLEGSTALVVLLLVASLLLALGAVAFHRREYQDLT